MFRIGDYTAEEFEFPLHQQAGRALLYELCDTDRRGVSAMRRAEGIVNINVAKRSQLLGKRTVIFLLFGMKAKILQQYHIAIS